MKLTIVSVGKKSSTKIKSLCDEYEKRLPNNLEVLWRFIDHAGQLPKQKRKDLESQRIATVCKNNFVVLLDERGIGINNQDFANQLQTWEQGQHNVAFVIGGAYGVNQEIVQPDLIWSLSSLVFPHELVRLILVEQIYRANTIARGLPYHHE